MTKEVVETTSSILVASLVISFKEITPRQKRTQASEKGKSKADASIWDYATTAFGRAHNVITSGELKCLFEIPSYGESSYPQARSGILHLDTLL